jgi:hypothetical protein
MPTYFCDGLKDVAILNGVVRLDFQRFETVAAEGNREVRAVSEFIVALPVQGFAQMLRVLETVRDRLVREGIFKTAGAEDAAAAPPVPPNQRSPNF